MCKYNRHIFPILSLILLLQAFPVAAKFGENSMPVNRTIQKPGFVLATFGSTLTPERKEVF